MLTDADILKIATGTETGGTAGDGPREHHFDDAALIDFARQLVNREQFDQFIDVSNDAYDILALVRGGLGLVEAVEDANGNRADGETLHAVNRILRIVCARLDRLGEDPFCARRDSVKEAA